MTLKRLPALSALASSIANTLANNITVSNVTITQQNSVTKTAMIHLDLTWENSWRVTNGPANWDAAWVFVKFHLGDQNWRHAWLSTNAADHAVPGDVQLDLGRTDNRGLGVFLYRNAPGAGTNQWSSIQLKWMYGAQGVPDAARITADVQAIEMVYVPQGAFYVGDGSTNSLSSFRVSGSDAPYLVNSENAITLSSTMPGALDFAPVLALDVTMGQWDLCSLSPYGLSPFMQEPVTNQVWFNTYNSPLTLSNAFPKGYRGYYVMKYEVSWAQYNDFAVKSGRPSDGPGSERAWQASSTATAVQDVLAYLDWTGLRPLTELEYEKACRGPLAAFPDEYAWGNQLVAYDSYRVTNANAFNAAIIANYATNAGNCWWISTLSTNANTCRVGIFARPAYAAGATARVQSGASYYGAMELTGNAPELYMLVQNDGLNPSPFDGAHGRGTGAAIPESWSATMIVRGDVTCPVPAEMLGPSMFSIRGQPTPVSHRLSDRGTNQLGLYQEYCYPWSGAISPTSTNLVGVSYTPGIRGGRTAP